MGRRTENPWLDRLFTAGVSLVGVVIGAVLAVSTTYYFEQRSETREFDAAVRVIDDELLNDATFLWFLYEQEEVPTFVRDSPPEELLATDAWPDYRGVLARRASDETWDRLTIAYHAVSLMRAVLLGLKVGAPIEPSQKDSLYNACHLAQRARFSLLGSTEVGTIGCEAER